MSFGNTAKDGSGTAYWLLVDNAGRLVTTPAWAEDNQLDAALNDSDKSFTVPASTQWLLKSVWVELTSTATAGNRVMVVEIQDDSANVIARFIVGLTQAASLTYYYMFAPQVPDLTAVRNSTHVSTPIPEIELNTSFVVRVYDIAAIDAAADDMTVRLSVYSRSTT